MKKNKILTIFIILAVALLFSSNVFAGPSDPGYGLISPSLQTTMPNLWATVSYIVQFLAVACVVFAGVRYMFAGSAQKADIKKGMIYLAIGGILVFGAITVIQVTASII